MNYCPACAAPLVERVPEGDDRPRHVCPACDAVHYRNPIPVVGCVVERGSEVLLCRRAIEPSHGLWTLPAGFLEIGETARAGARRETWEEACADVEIIAPFAQFDLPHIGQTYSMFRARMRTPEFAAGDESLEVEFVDLAHIPWSELAFPVIHFALRYVVEDRAAQRSALHLGALVWNGEGSRFDAGQYAVDEYDRIDLDARSSD